MTPAAVDTIRLNFSPEGLMALNVILALIMYGVSLDIQMADFKRVIGAPKGPLVALAAQVFLVPAIAVGLIYVLDPLPSIALGMVLVAACPSGNMSNFLTHLAKGNTPLSISATALSTLAAVVVTPFSLAFWGSIHPKTAGLLRDVKLDPIDMLGTIVLILGLPLALGMLTAARKPAWADRIRKPIKNLSLVFFVSFVVIALQANFRQFVDYIGLAMLAVFLENTLSFMAGYAVARAARLSAYDARAVCIEVGIHNSGLGLILVFTFFEGNGGMAIVAAWWGIWHIIAGLALAFYWSRRPVAPLSAPVPATAAT